MKPTTKFCKDCGKIMWDVDPRLKLCDACREKHRQAFNKRCRKEFIKPASRKKKKACPAVKPIDQCNREAAALGITYGKFVSLGLDKEDLSDRL